MADTFDRAAALQGSMVTHRRRLHARPEVGLELPETGDYIERHLRDLGLTTERHHGAGVSAVVPGTASGRVAATVLRSDMDALPVHEATGLPFSSTLPGVMHACGHDLHMAMLLGAAEALTTHPPEQDVVLAFQPGEESDRGAVPMLGRHRNLQLDRATTFAIHVHATWPAHHVYYRRGTFMAYGDWFEASFQGPGGHASQPEATGNPIEAGALFVAATRALVAELATKEAVVATVTEFLMGNTVNVIPDHGSLRGTLRTLSAEQRDALIAGLTAAVAGAATESRTTGRFTLREGYPAVVNDEEYVDRMVAAFARSRAADGLTEMSSPSMVIEDFAYFLQRWPGAMVYLGARVDGRDSFNHAPDADFDEAVLTTGLALHLMVAEGIGAAS